MLRKIILSVAMLLCLSGASAQVKFESEASLMELQKAAVEQKKLIFIDVYATWCPPCKVLDRDVFSRRDIGEFVAEHFIAAKFDIDKPMGQDLARKFNISSIPTLLFFDAEGNLLGRMQGAVPAQAFKQEMLRLLEE